MTWARQPLLARLEKGLFQNILTRFLRFSLKSAPCEGGLKARNCNTPEEFKEIESSCSKLINHFRIQFMLFDFDSFTK